MALGVADRWADLAVATWSTTWNYGPGWEEPVLDATASTLTLNGSGTTGCCGTWGRNAQTTAFRGPVNQAAARRAHQDRAAGSDADQAIRLLD